MDEADIISENDNDYEFSVKLHYSKKMAKNKVNVVLTGVNAGIFIYCFDIEIGKQSLLDHYKGSIEKQKAQIRRLEKKIDLINSKFS